jgi:hypothetical protein
MSGDTDVELLYAELDIALKPDPHVVIRAQSG